MGVNSIMNDAGRIGFVIRGDYSATETYDFLDIAYFNGATYVAKKLTVGNTPDNTEFWHILADGSIDVNDVAPTFLQAKTRENINSGEKLPVLFGKIKKWYTDLKAVAFSGSYNDLSDTPTIPAAVAVKGNAESSYRTGNVNLTPANIGAVPTANVLDSKESITANTASGNVAGALGTKEINANLQSQIDTLNSNLSNYKKIMSRMYNTNWGNSLIVPPLAHGFIIIGEHSIYLVWVVNSYGSFELNYSSIYGANDATFTCKAENGELTVTTPYYSGITYIGR